jgi:hypothetical protein
MATPYKIYEYWTTVGHARLKELLGEVPSQLLYLDTEYPECFACGKPGSTVKNPRNVRDYWNKSKRLEKCHIIPACLGGSNTVENLVMMCRDCNMSNPETNLELYFWLWFKARKKMFAMFGIDDWVYETVKTLCNDVEFSLTCEELTQIVDANVKAAISNLSLDQNGESRGRDNITNGTRAAILIESTKRVIQDINSVNPSLQLQAY